MGEFRHSRSGRQPFSMVWWSISWCDTVTYYSGIIIQLCRVEEMVERRWVWVQMVVTMVVFSRIVVGEGFISRTPHDPSNFNSPCGTISHMPHDPSNFNIPCGITPRSPYDPTRSICHAGSCPAHLMRPLISKFHALLDAGHATSCRKSPHPATHIYLELSQLFR